LKLSAIYLFLVAAAGAVLSTSAVSMGSGEATVSSNNSSNLFTENACKKSGINYARLADQNNIDELALLFTEDAEFVLAGRSFKGRKAIKSLFLMLQKRKDHISRHLVSNYLVEVGENGSIKGSSYITLFRLPKKGEKAAAPVLPDAFAEYDDDYQMSAGRCLIKRREINLVYLRQKDNKS